jgi:hypothetical protein
MSTDLDDEHLDELDEGQPEPGEETFWQAHSPRFEMPISFTTSAFILAGMFALMLALFFAANIGPKQDGVPIVLSDGEDESGDGMQGGGGENNPIAIGFTPPTEQDAQNLPHPDAIPEIRQDIQDALRIEDPNSVIPLPSEKVLPYASFDKAIRDKMLGIGTQKGTPGGPGKGDDGPGPGPGGKGASSTRARSMRWIMRFSTRSGRDYLDQLATLKAVVVVPLPPDGKQAYVFRDLINPKPGTYIEEKEILKLSGQIQFCDYKKSSVTEVSSALNLNFTPTCFMAFFPRDLEGELARLEVAYGNKQPEQIEETVFEVTVRGGESRIVVASQKLKR